LQQARFPFFAGENVASKKKKACFHLSLIQTQMYVQNADDFSITYPAFACSAEKRSFSDKITFFG